MENKLAIIVSHPIQHFCPQYASWAAIPEIHVKVFFGSALGYKSYFDPNFKQEITWNHLRLDRFDHVFLNGDAILPSNPALDAPTLDNHLDEFGPDWIICYGYFQQLQRRAALWARKNKVSLAYISDSELRNSTFSLKALLKYPFLRAYFSKIDKFLSVGDANEDYYRRYGVPKNKMLRMHFPIDRELYRSKYDERTKLRSALRARLSIPEDEFVALIVGKLVKWKSQHHLIDALKILENSPVKVHALIVGSGEMLQEWTKKSKTLNRNQVHFTGFVSPEILPDYYAATDVYVHPAAYEPHSIAISEAIYMGCPVILSDRCGSYGENDDVQPNKNGLVYSWGNIEELAHHMAFLIQNEAKRTLFSQHSAKISREFQNRSHGGFIGELVSMRPS